MDAPTEISRTTSVSRYRTRSTQTWRGPTQHTRLQKLPPLVVPEELPETTMRRIFKEGEYEAIFSYLMAYQRAGDMRRWDDFRNKIPPDLLKLWGDVLIECRRNGFIGPRVENGEIVWMQVIGTTDVRNGDLCTMCDRACRRREMTDTGASKQMRILHPGWHEARPCWDKADETP